MTQFRFTFVYDRHNRTATAALLAALEDVVADPQRDLRAVRTDGVRRLELASSGSLTEIVCMSSMTAGFPRVVGLLKSLRATPGGRSAIAICGGPHPTGDPRGVLEAGFDYCCVGEGEEVVRDVAACPALGRSLDSVSGLVRLEAGGIAGRRRRAAVDIDKYRPLPAQIKFPTHIEIGRGCRWGCAYCQTPLIHGSTERFRSIEAIETIVARYADFGMKDYRFLLPNALGYAATEPGSPNCEALDELLARCRPAARGGRIFLGSFPSEVRPDYVTGEAVRVLKTYVSNNKLVIGGQSGSPRILELIRRGHTVEDTRRACAIVAEGGFVPAVDIVLGLPGESEDDRHETLGFIRELARAGAVVNMHFFMPLSGTDLAGMDPVYLTEGERRELDRLAQQGIVRGGWRRQEEMARRWQESRREQDPTP